MPRCRWTKSSQWYCRREYDAVNDCFDADEPNTIDDIADVRLIVPLWFRICDSRFSNVFLPISEPHFRLYSMWVVCSLDLCVCRTVSVCHVVGEEQFVLAWTLRQFWGAIFNIFRFLSVSPLPEGWFYRNRRLCILCWQWDIGFEFFIRASHQRIWGKNRKWSDNGEI